MSPLLGLAIIVVAGYLAAHVALGWIAERFNVVSGAEYLLLGFLLGPQVLGVLDAGAVGGFAPILTLALGWIGVVVGAQFYLPDLLRLPRVHYRIAFAEALISLAVVSACMAYVFHALFGMSGEEALIPAVATGAIATASAPTGIALVARRLGPSDAVIRQLQLTAAIDAVVAIAAFGLLLSFDHAPPGVAVRPLTTTEWAVVSLAIGVVGGSLFHLFLAEEHKIDRLFIALAGATILASGAAAYLRLSPLLPAMLIGIILVNTATPASRAEIRHVLGVVERPLYFVLLVFAGAAWRPAGWAWLLPVLVFLAARVAAKLGGSFAGAALNGALPTLGPGWGRALLGQGGLAIAIALNYVIQDRSLLADVIFSAAILSVLVADVGAAKAAEGVVQSARRRRRALAGGTAPRRPAEGGA